MQIILRLAASAALVTSLAAPALAQTPLPPGASAAPEVKALLSYSPAVTPGATDFDPADRAAISDLLAAYAFAYDNSDTGWFSLFTDDAVFVAGVPGEVPVSFTGEGFRSFWTERMKAFSTSGHMRRHLMVNILYLDQTATSAHISVAGLLTDADKGKDFKAVSSLNYEGWLVKQDGVWKIQRWHDFPDAVVGE